MRQDKRDAQIERAKTPASCPIDGERLDVRGSKRNCPLGNYSWP
jgi:hypothetical protein